MTEESRLDLAARYLPHCSPWLELTEASGSWLHGSDNSKYLDFGTGGLYSPMGHKSSVPNFVLREHLEHHLFPGDPGEVASLYVVRYAQDLSGMFPADDERQVLVCSGVAEARQVVNRLADERGGVEVRAISSGHSLGMLADVVEQARREGTLVIADETITGFGRTGRFLAVDHFDLVPDIVLLGPSGAGGLPFAAVVAPRSVFDAVEMLPPVFTSPVVCAAAWGILKTMLPALFDYVASVGAVLKEAIADLVVQFPDQVQGLTGVGMLAQIHLVEPGDTRRFWEQCRHRGLILWDDLTMTPPLTVTRDEILQAVDMMAQVLLEWEEPR